VYISLKTQTEQVSLVGEYWSFYVCRGAHYLFTK